jgi:hypothetical protein
MPTSRQHTKPSVPIEAQEAEKIAKHMYNSLTQQRAPKAHSQGYIMGACTVLKMLLDQAAQQGSDKEELKKLAVSFIMQM